MAEVLEEGPDTTLDLTNEHLRSLEGVEIKPNLTTVDLTANRLREIDERLLALTGLQSLCLRQNLLPSGAWANRLASAPRLRDLELRDNALTEFPRMDAGFSRLERLDLSYNEIRSAAALQTGGLAADAGRTLRELYLANNKIAGLMVAGGVEEEEEGAGAAGGAGGAGGDGAAAGDSGGGDDDDDTGAAAAAATNTTNTTTTSVLRGLTALTVLELGSNRIRRVEGLEDQRQSLRDLWLGRNRIGPAVGPGLSGLSLLRRLSLQSNRLESMAGLGGCAAVEELYLSHNGIRALEGLEALPRLRVLDVSSNRLAAIGAESLAAQSALEDLWLNDNAIGDFSRLREELRSCRSTLATVYLDGNPAAARWKSERRYRRELAGGGEGGEGEDGGPLLPALEQLDSDVLPEAGPKREAWVAAEGAPGARMMGPEADQAALREATAAAAARRVARAQAEAAAAAATGDGAGGGNDAPPRGSSG